jgi:hypothetical protein
MGTHSYNQDMKAYEVVESSLKGSGVIALIPFAEHAPIMPFSGKLYRWVELKKLIPIIGDHYVQVGRDLYMGPDGNADDYVNHSCNPNSYLRCDGFGKAELFALKPIAAGEEITWDYSTTTNEADYALHCKCGSSLCRQIIGGYQTLPPSRKAYYVNLGIIPSYLLD